MKRDRLRQSMAFLFIGLVLFAFVNVSCAAMLNGVEVEVPYAVTNAQWWTGVAIKNLDVSGATDTISINFFDQEGMFMGTVNIGSLEPLELYSQMTSSIYFDPLPLNYSMRISHPGCEELAVTVFVGNSTTGGFAYQTYHSQACCQATTVVLPSWDQILPAAERFELVLDDEAVLDRETGLVWQRDTSNTQYDWYDAQSYCYSAIIGGRGGWRLPSVEELRTLIDPTESDPALTDGHPFTVLSPYYWSSTTHATNASYAWIVYFSNGGIGGHDKVLSYHVRAVRSGQ